MTGVFPGFEGLAREYEIDKAMEAARKTAEMEAIR